MSWDFLGPSSTLKSFLHVDVIFRLFGWSQALWVREEHIRGFIVQSFFPENQLQESQMSSLLRRVHSTCMACASPARQFRCLGKQCRAAAKIRSQGTKYVAKQFLMDVINLKPCVASSLWTHAKPLNVISCL